MIAGVVIDNWKLPIFKRRLDESGYSYTEHPNFTKGTMVLKVTTESAEVLAPIIKAAQMECAERTKR